MATPTAAARSRRPRSSRRPRRSTSQPEWPGISTVAGPSAGLNTRISMAPSSARRCRADTSAPRTTSRLPDAGRRPGAAGGHHPQRQPGGVGQPPGVDRPDRHRIASPVRAQQWGASSRSAGPAGVGPGGGRRAGQHAGGPEEGEGQGGPPSTSSYSSRPSWVRVSPPAVDKSAGRVGRQGRLVRAPLGGPSPDGGETRTRPPCGRPGAGAGNQARSRWSRHGLSKRVADPDELLAGVQLDVGDDLHRPLPDPAAVDRRLPAR